MRPCGIACCRAARKRANPQRSSRLTNGFVIDQICLCEAVARSTREACLASAPRRELASQREPDGRRRAPIHGHLSLIVPRGKVHIVAVMCGSHTLPGHVHSNDRERFPAALFGRELPVTDGHVCHFDGFPIFLNEGDKMVVRVFRPVDGIGLGPGIPFHGSMSPLEGLGGKHSECD